MKCSADLLAYDKCKYNLLFLDGSQYQLFHSENFTPDIYSSQTLDIQNNSTNPAHARTCSDDWHKTTNPPNLKKILRSPQEPEPSKPAPPADGAWAREVGLTGAIEALNTEPTDELHYSSPCCQSPRLRRRAATRLTSEPGLCLASRGLERLEFLANQCSERSEWVSRLFSCFSFFITILFLLSISLL